MPAPAETLEEIADEGHAGGGSHRGSARLVLENGRVDMLIGALRDVQRHMDEGFKRLEVVIEKISDRNEEDGNRLTKLEVQMRTFAGAPQNRRAQIALWVSVAAVGTSILCGGTSAAIGIAGLILSRLPR